MSNYMLVLTSEVLVNDFSNGLSSYSAPNLDDSENEGVYDVPAYSVFWFIFSISICSMTGFTSLSKITTTIVIHICIIQCL